MTGTLEKTPSNRAAGCPPPPGRRLVAARALAVALLVLIVAFGEVKLIEQAAASEANRGTGARNELLHIVNSSLVSGLAPIALPPRATATQQRKAS
jgi:hypothetical protein